MSGWQLQTSVIFVYHHGETEEVSGTAVQFNGQHRDQITCLSIKLRPAPRILTISNAVLCDGREVLLCFWFRRALAGHGGPELPCTTDVTQTHARSEHLKTVMVTHSF